jgi:uncharacterized protein (PEP-CTERM system associated)
MTTHRTWTCLLSVLGVLGVLLPSAHVQAQTAQAGASGRSRIEYRLDSRVRWSDQVGGGAVSSASGGAQVELSPGFLWSSTRPGLRGSVDYGLTLQSRTAGNEPQQLRHALNSALQLELVDQHAYLDLAGTVSRQPVSALGTLSGSAVSDVNQAQTSSWRLSPVVRGLLPHRISLEARHAWNLQQSDAGNRPDSLGQTSSLALSQPLASGASWSLTGAEQVSSYQGAAIKARLTSLQGQMNWPWGAQWAGNLRVGSETSNQQRAGQGAQATYGAGLVWRPSERTRFSGNVVERFFGRSHDIAFSHRMARSAFTLTDVRDLSLGTGTETAVLGTLRELFDLQLTPLEADPIARARLVDAELRRRGLSGSTPVAVSYLTSRPTLRRSQTASFLWTTTRQTYAVNWTQSDTRTLSGDARQVGDDLDQGGEIQTTGWQLTFSHRLTPVATLSAGWSAQSSEAPRTGVRSATHTGQLGLSTRFGLRTSGGLQWRQSRSQTLNSATHENELIGNLLHQF